MEIIDSQKFRAKAKKELDGGFLFFGEEEYLKHSCLDIARKSVLGENTGDSFNHIRIDAGEESFSHADIENAILALPVFSDKKLVEIHNLNLSQYKEKALTELKEILSLLEENPETVLIIYCAPHELEKFDMRRPPKLVTELAEVLCPVNFEKQTRDKLIKWIAAHFTHNKVNITPEFCALLIDTCGADMYALSGEIDKLSSYILSTGRAALEPGDIELMASRCREVGEYDFSNAILQRNREKAFYILSKYELEDKSEANVGMTMGSIIRIFSLLYRISLLSRKGMLDRDIAKLLKMNEYQCGLYRKSLGNRTPEELEKILLLCEEADALLKSGGAQGYVVLSRLITEATL